MRILILFLCFISTGIHSYEERMIEAKLECHDGVLKVRVLNKSSHEVYIPFGLLGIDNNYGWNSFMVMESSKYYEMLRKSPASLKGIVLPVKQGGKEPKNYTLKPFDEVEFLLDLNKGYDLEDNKEYAAALVVVQGKVLLDKTTPHKITTSSNPIIFSKNYCLEQPELVDKRTKK